MKKLIMLIAFSSFLVLGCAENIAKQVDADEFEELIINQAHVQIIDVRTPDEYAQGYIEKSQLIDFNGEDFEIEIEKLNKNKPVAVYCHSGGRSNQAFEMMKEMGFRQIYELQGGIVAWQQNGKQINK